MKVLRVQNIYFTATNTDSVKAFYENLLGLQTRFADGSKWLQYSVTGTNIALASHEEAGEHRNAVVVFEIDNEESVVEKVQELGGEVFDIRDMAAHGKVFSVRDPVGNTFQLFTKSRTEEE